MQPMTGTDRHDALIAAGIFLLALLIYIAALAPDVLFSDSGEFQALAYTWGTTHTTGYPVYQVIARIVGLLPVNSLAWRVNFVSALGGALALAVVYCITRHFARRGGAVLASLTLLVGYTFWTQSIIAEVYTPAAALLALVIWLLLRWSDVPTTRRGLLFAAAFLAGLGLGMHLFTLMIVGLPAAVFVLWSLFRDRSHWRQTLALSLAGAISGMLAFFLLFTFIDTRPTATNIFTTTIYPSREAWNLDEADFDTPFERFWISVSGRQWQDRMLPSDLDYAREIDVLLNDYLPREFAPAALLLAMIGVVGALRHHAHKAMLPLLVFVVGLWAALSYDPGDKYIFYLPAYVMLAIFAGVGAGTLAEGFLKTGWLIAYLTPRPPLRFREGEQSNLQEVSDSPLQVGEEIRGEVKTVTRNLLLLLLLTLCISPFLPSRLEAAQTGVSTFFDNRYVYPINDLGQPRRLAECALELAPEPDAFIVMGWQALYSVYYVAHVERGQTGLDIREALPYGTRGMAGTLQDEIATAMEAGRPVYVDVRYDELTRSYTYDPGQANCDDYALFRLRARE